VPGALENVATIVRPDASVTVTGTFVKHVDPLPRIDTGVPLVMTIPPPESGAVATTL